jgi:Na+-translocating ferredoxin:NAD+ oxidoreductase RNF subunit RnfB
MKYKMNIIYILVLVEGIFLGVASIKFFISENMIWAAIAALGAGNCILYLAIDNLYVRVGQDG